ncbi:Major facilitator superfamily transporter [Colletotrichum sp. SAR 10_65]|nr:Major facilitator superfamily transporter [Colletotrichum sp. SAR 10_65]
MVRQQTLYTYSASTPPFKYADNIRGLSNSFGVFQAYYSTNLLPDTNPSTIAWIGSIQIFLMMLIGVCAGWLLDAGYLRFILVCGTAMTSLGLFMLSLCTKYWQILLAQAFCVGIGSGLLGLTCVAVIPLYFQKRRMIATGIAATGSSLAFALMIGSVYIPFFYVDAYAIRLGVDESTSFYILSAMNAASLFGRLAPNWLADKYGGISIMMPCCLGSAVVLFLLRFAHDMPGLIAVSVVYGFVSGGMVSLPPATIANLTDDMADYGTRMGMGYTIASIGALIGNPIGGAAQRLFAGQT